MSPLQLRPEGRRRRARGFTLVEIVVVVVVIAALAAIAALTYANHVAGARRNAALEQMRQVAVSAAAKQAKDDLDPHTALEQAATECNCFVSVDPASNALLYQKAGTSVYATAANGKVSAATAPANYSPYAATVLSTHPTAFWRLNETVATNPALDSAGTLAGSYSTGFTLGRTPAGNLDGKAAQLNGAAALTLPISANLTLSNSSFAVAAWVNPSTAPAGWTQWLGSGPGGIGVGLTAGKFTATQTNIVDAPNGPVIALNKWTFVVASYDAGTRALVYYVDGKAVTTTTWTSQVAAQSGQSTLVGGSQGYGAYWNGDLDEVAVWRTPLSAAQVAQLYRVGTGS